MNRRSFTKLLAAVPLLPSALKVANHLVAVEKSKDNSQTAKAIVEPFAAERLWQGDIVVACPNSFSVRRIRKPRELMFGIALDAAKKGQRVRVIREGAATVRMKY